MPQHDLQHPVHIAAVNVSYVEGQQYQANQLQSFLADQSQLIKDHLDQMMAEVQARLAALDGEHQDAQIVFQAVRDADVQQNPEG